MKLDWKRNFSFPRENRKYTWSDVQRLDIAHIEYYLIYENVDEWSFLKSVRHFASFGKFYQLLGER